MLSACRTNPSASDLSTANARARLPYGAKIAGISVSRLYAEEARSILAKSLGSPSITLNLKSDIVEISGYSLGLRYDLDAAITAAYSEKEISAVAIRVDEAVLQARLEQFAKQTQVAPIDAAVTVDSTRAELFSYQQDADGALVDVDALADAIQLAAEQGSSEVDVPLLPLKADVTTEEVMRLTQPLSSFSTSFAEYPLNKANRMFNIQKAAAAIHGTVLSPGEEFDCNAVIGDRTAENGWKEAAAIRDGMDTTEYGGGVCQVSTTLFNAVLMADLTITERYPHSWPMRYVSIGRDATISTGGKNFRFVNNFDTPITIGMQFDSNNMTLTCTIYGAPLPDGQYIHIRSEQTATLDLPPDELILDESLPLNTSITARESRTGKTSVTYKDYYAADGTLLRTETAYQDTYRSIAARRFVSSDLYYP